MSRKYDLGFEKGNSRKELKDSVIHWGQVLVPPTEDPSGAGRAKVFIREFDRDLVKLGLNENDIKKNPENYSDLINNLPWSLPLNPKFITVYPKKYEMVLVILSDQSNERIDRFYMGPFISQPQFFQKDGDILEVQTGRRGTSRGIFGYDNAWFKINGSRLGGENSESNWAIYGNGPKEIEDVTINGRGNEDIILRTSKKYDEVLLRVAKYDKKNNKVLNLKNPGYLSLVYYDSTKIPSLNGEDKASINIVADQINLVSHKGSPTKGKPNKGEGIILNSSEPNKQINLENTNLHPTVYGDILWDVLKRLRVWVENHKHRGGGVAYTEPSKDVETVELLKSLDFALGPEPQEKVSPNGQKYFEYGGNLISNNIKIN
jgi:hypothetical protein